jgi:hypothetical protein
MSTLELHTERLDDAEAPDEVLTRGGRRVVADVDES